MSPQKPRRITVRLSSPNPLFEKWLTEWRDQAKEKESKMEYCFLMALRSLQKYPLPLQTGKDCKVLRGFGDKICKMLDDKLRDYKSNNTVDPDATMIGTSFETPADSSCNTKSKQNGRKKDVAKGDTSREYVPQRGSGAFAILIALYKLSSEPEYIGYSSKSEITSCGQSLCTTSFTKANASNRYTAWASMRTLLEKRLVHKQSNPAKFSLTDEGQVLAHKLYVMSEDTENDNSQPNNLVTIPIGEICKESTDTRLMQKDAVVEFIENASEKRLVGKDTKHRSQTLYTRLQGKSGSSSGVSCQSSMDSGQEETVFMLPNTFDIILLVDTQETTGSKRSGMDDPIINELLRLKVNLEIRQLKVGDYAWICRTRTPPLVELVLPYVMERKRLDDFGHSIKDGRFHEQKFRLRQCGIQNLIYLIEKYEHHLGLPMTSLLQAATNTSVQDEFTVKFTENIKDTCMYLCQMTRVLEKYYKAKTFMSCTKKDLTPSTPEDDLIPLMTFKEFSKAGLKNKQNTVKDLFVRQLLQIKGMSVEKALAVVGKYPTVKHLKNAYSELSDSEAEKLLSSLQFGKLRKNLGPILSRTVYQLYSLKTFL